jgi:GTP-binding protein YchF
VGVPDQRLDRVAATVGARPVVHETIQFHDIAGLVRGAHDGEGLGNKFLANIRETDAILHVVRAHDDPQVVHPEGRVDPLADADTIETELLFADLEQAERRLERVSKQAKSLDKVAVAEERWLGSVIDALRAGHTVRTVPEPEDAPGALRRLAPLTSKPVLYVANVAEGEPMSPPPALVAHAEERGARATAVSARLDAELSELDDEEAEAMRGELGVAESGLETVIREAFALLDLIQFFTGGQDKEARAWAIPRGTRARSAAGAIHTDMARGFVAAEVTPWEALVDSGGYTAARERALTRVEGREYEMRDGDVVTFRFTPS